MIQENITFQKQRDGFSCAAIAYSSLLGLSLAQAIKECRTTKKGTYIEDVAAAFEARGINNYLVIASEGWENIKDNLIKLSYKFPIILSGEYKNRYYARGRDRTNHHATLLVDGILYDGGLEKEIPAEAYLGANKRFFIKSYLIVDQERVNFKEKFNEQY